MNRYSTLEIELTFLMYPIASKQLFKNRLLSDIEVSYYKHIQNTCSFWLSLLTDEEKKVIEYRCFNQKSYTKIADLLHYADHSVIIRKYQKILLKIQNVYQ